jgi:predicted secreted hydrolase
MTDEGRRFGYQFTIFRSGVTPGIQNDSSLFSSSSYYTVHIGISDLQNNKFYSFERNTRGMKGLAESAPGENRIYVENNELTFDFSNDATSPKLFITSSNKEFTLNFSLIPEKPVVLHGNNGLSSKSDKPGNASYYYSYTRLKTEGELKHGNESHKLKGNSWMDREWSTSALDKDQKGWDWFALQIDDGTDLMYFRLRDSQSKTLYQKGTLVKKDGSFKDLSNNDLKITLVSSVKIRGVEYPSSWKIDLVTQGTSYQVSTSMKDQTHQFRIKYYEGAVDVLKLSGTGDIKGKGYVELTGYNE